MPERYLIMIGSPESPGLKLLKKVSSDVQRIKAFFTDPSQGYTPVLEKEIPIGASSTAVRQQMEQWFAESHDEEDIVVLYIAGHGDFFNGRFHDACLLFSDSDDRRPSSVIRVSELFRLIFDGSNSRPQHILLLLDVCYGGALASEGIAAIAGKSVTSSKAAKGLYILGAATPDSLAEDGLFLEAWMKVYEDEAWEPAGEFWHIDSLVEGINHRFELLKKWQRADYYVHRGTGIPRFIKARKPGRLRSYELENLSYWEIKARGIDTAGMKEWFFTGRESALLEIVSWLQDESPAYNCCMVTGDPGSGKSALLGRLLLSCLPETRPALLTGLELAENDPSLPRMGVIQVYFNARGAWLRDVILAIGRQLQTDAQTAEALQLVMSRLPLITGLIIDSLDEAADPAAILGLLESLATAPSVRILVGSRRGTLLHAWQGPKKVIDLDQAPWFSAADMESYVGKRLKSLSPGGSAEAIGQLSERIAAAAQHSFLYARVVSRYFGDKVHSPQDWSGRLALPESVIAAFGQDLQRFGSEQRKRLMDLLTPLAYAGGKGLPQKNIWAALASHCSGNEYSNNDIRELKELAGYYLIKDTEEEEVVYRLFHQTFTDYIRNSTRDEAVEEKITEGLLMLMKKDGKGNPSWEYTTEPYLRRHFAAHAARAGMLDQFLTDLDFLLHYPPESVLPVIVNLSSGQRKSIGNAYRRASHWLKAGVPIFLSQLALRAQEHGAKDLATRIQESTLPQEWKQGWGKWRTELAYVVRVNMGKEITRIASFEDSILGPVAVCALADKSITVWRLTDGRLLKEYPPDPPDEGSFITDLTVCREGDDLYFAVAWYKTSVSLYRLAVSAPLTRIRLNSGINAMVLGIPDGHLMLILSTTEEDDSATVRWFAGTGLTPAGETREAALNAIYSLHLDEFQGIPVLIAGGDHLGNAQLGPEPKPVKIWSLREKTLIWECPDVERGTFRYVYPLHYEGKLWIIVFSSISQVGFLYDVEGMRTFPLSGKLGAPKVLIGYRIREGKLEMLGQYFSDIFLYTIDLRAPQPQLQIHLTDIGLLSNQWATPVILFGRQTLIDDEGQQLRIWDFEEAIDLAAANIRQDDLAATKPPVYNCLSGAKGLLAGATEEGKLTVWDIAGNQLAEKTIHPIKNVQLIGSGDDSMLVVLTEEPAILLYTAANLSLEKRIALEDLQARHLHVFRQEDRWLALAVVEIKDEGDDRYIARLIDLQSGAEIPSRDEVMDEYLFRIPGYDDKTLYTATVLRKPHPRAVVAGPNGQVRAIRLEFPGKTEDWFEIFHSPEWELNNYNYIFCLAAFEEGEKGRLIAGDDSGFLGSFELTDAGAATVAKVQGHSKGVRALLVYSSPKGTLVVSAGEDGFIHFWTADLIHRYTIHFEHPIYDLALFGDDILAIACNKGLVTLQPDWEKILS